MDREVAAEMAAFTTAIRYDTLPLEVVERLKASLVDSLGCALAALDEGAVRSARDGVRRLSRVGPADILGTRDGATADLAGFANGVAIRCLDWSDLYLTAHGGMMPSDNIGALLALAQSERLSGRDLLRALAVAYEVTCRLREATHTQLKAKGWDGVSLIAPAAACGAASLLGLDATRTRHALALALVSCASGGTMRTGGDLSMWKGGMGADAARRGVLSAVLAAAGMTGPAPSFEGESGAFQQVTGEFSWPGDGDWRIHRVHRKRFSALAATHAGNAAAVEVHRTGLPIAEIDRVTVHTFAFLSGRTGRLEPTTRETADHSQPYCVAVGLLDGDVGPLQFSAERLRAADVRALITRIEIVEDPSYTALWPDVVATRVAARTRSGRTETAEALLKPRGLQPPIVRSEVEHKLGAAVPAVNRDTALALARRMWALEQEEDLAALPLRELVSSSR